MPILEYQCPHCGKKFDEIVKTCEEKVLCPACGQTAERVWSGTVYSSTGKPPKNCKGDCSCCGGCK